MALSSEEVVAAFDRLNVWSRGSERAPHKPLLVLYALGRLSRGEPESVSFRELAPVLTELLKEFGPTRKSYHPEYPFWRLQKDQVWALEGTDGLELRRGHSDAKKSELLAHDIHGHFTEEIAQSLKNDPELITKVALRLLDGHFPPSLHEDILDAVGLDLHPSETVTRRKRDPEFRGRVLKAYEFSCAVCGFDVRIGSKVVGLEAAHIKWHQAGGPDQEANGFALCSLHHKAFDLGAFTVEPSRVLLVSEHAYGRQGFDEWLLRYHGQTIREPVRAEYAAGERFLAWHEREVFKRPPRELRLAG